MPNPKVGTVTMDVTRAIQTKLKPGKIPEYRTDIEKKITDEEKAGTS